MALLSPAAATHHAVYAQFVTRWAFLNFASGPGLPLVFLLYSTFTYGNTRVLEATDPRDYAFALLGLATDSGQLGLCPDYSQSETLVFIALARALIQHGYLIVLSWCRTKGRRNSLPSWVPDLAQKIYRPLQWVERVSGTDLVSPQPRFAASLGLQAKNESEPLYSTSKSTLQLYGAFFDTIQSSGASFSELYDRTSYGPRRVARACIRLLKEIKLLQEEHEESDERIEMPSQAEALWRTSVADTEMTQSWDKARKAGRFGQLHQSLYRGNLLYRVILKEDILREHFTMMDLVNIGRRPFISSKCHLGLGPEQLGPGDSIVVFCGADMPYIMRGRRNASLILIGDAYVDSIMDGEFPGTSPLVERFNID
ncbi:hypothetical protein MMC13_001022 [Lambiella insularis]|nr:hypothetical protein [Lambiella insularis]